MTFLGFPPAGLALLARLPTLDSAGFSAVRPDWEEHVLNPARDLVDDLGAQLTEQISPGLIAEPKVNGSIAPINRDLRFNPDGPRYKDHVMFRFWEGTPKKTAPTLFLRIDPGQIGFASGVVFASTDRWRAAVGDPPVAEELRRLIEDIQAAIGDVDIAGADLKRVPSPFPPDHPGADLLRHKATFQLRWAEPLPEEVSTGALTAFCTARLSKLAGLHRWLVAQMGAS
ncbi:DUF2461 family protein [Mycobacterium spongiae]|nr:DUF2461 family protein [Mycobacterium spongiae]